MQASDVHSTSSVGNAIRTAGVGTFRKGYVITHHVGCPGFKGPFPSAGLDECVKSTEPVQITSRCACKIDLQISWICCESHVRLENSATAISVSSTPEPVLPPSSHYPHSRLVLEPALAWLAVNVGQSDSTPDRDPKCVRYR